MARIDERLLKSLIYLYPTTDDALEGRCAGGAGFWVGIEAVEPLFWHPYIVTNSHVVRKGEGNSRVLRINKVGGGFDTIVTEETGWIYHPNADDVAVYPLNPDPLYDIRFVPADRVVSQEMMTKLDIGPGNDVIVISRFISHDGRLANTPALRFGNISMMPIEPVLTAHGIKQEAFLVEGRSLPGSSGSPVLVQFSLHDRLLPDGIPMSQKGVYLLGINAGHFHLIDPDFEVVRDAQGDPHPEGWRVRVNTGMMVVIPAWKIQEILDLPELIQKRKLAHEEHKKQVYQARAQMDAMGVPKEVQERLYPDHRKEGG